MSWIVTLPVTVVAVVFAVANREQVAVNLWPLGIIDLPLHLLILGCLFLGFLTGAAVAWLSGGRQRRRGRQAAERARELARQLAELQGRPAVREAGPAGGLALAGPPDAPAATRRPV